jgi:hypothetical protein
METDLRSRVDSSVADLVTRTIRGHHRRRLRWLGWESALESAESHVHIAGWHLSPDVAVTRDGRPVVLRNLLAELAERVEVRVLVWAGAPLPLFRPSRRSVREARERLTRGTRVRCALDSRSV